MSSNALAMIRHEPTMLATFDAAAHAAYLDEKRDLIRSMCIPDEFKKNDALFETFIELGKLRGLNPLLRQLWCIPRNRKPSIEVSIDGMRLIASRSRNYAGIDRIEYDTRPSEARQPGEATCTVYRLVQGVRCPFTATVYWEEFGRIPAAAEYHNQWKTMPYQMLGKTAESHALRKAFPEETSGLYTEDEMEQAGYGGTVPEREVRPAGKPIEQPIRATTLNSPRTTAGKASTTQIKRLMAARSEAGWTEEEMYRVIALNWPDAQRDGKPSVRELTAEQIGELILTVETPIEDDEIERASDQTHGTLVLSGPIRDDEIVVEQQALTTA